MLLIGNWPFRYDETAFCIRDSQETERLVPSVPVANQTRGTITTYLQILSDEGEWHTYVVDLEGHPFISTLAPYSLCCTSSSICASVHGILPSHILQYV